MVAVDLIRPGDVVMDRRLGLVWTVEADCDHGRRRLRRKGLTIVAHVWDLSVILKCRSRTIGKREPGHQL
jgi:hypothetical protein